MSIERILIVGAGTFGLSAALELRERGYEVDVLEAGEIPNPLAGGTDVSKVCRMEYGIDETYMAWMEAARLGWQEWNSRWRQELGYELYHETGMLSVSLEEMQPGGYEYESYQMLLKRGHSPERLGGNALTARFPAWSPVFADGFYHPKGGWAESGRVVESLAHWARAAGVGVFPHQPVEALLDERGVVEGVRSADGSEWPADHVVLACGSWLGKLVPGLSPAFEQSYHPVWHLEVRNPDLFSADKFPVFTADIATTGFYGFPFNLRHGILKVAHHGLSVDTPADGSLTVVPELTAKLYGFLKEYLPALADSDVVYTRLCPYCDTPDEDFWIARDPEREGLTVASGGSGHGFKFAPVLGELIADSVEGVENHLLRKFAWRPGAERQRGREAARCPTEGGLA